MKKSVANHANRHPLLGSHVSTAGGCDKAIDRALSIGSTAMQIFVKNNMQWFAKPLTTKDADAFTKHPRRAELRSVFGHSGYLINPAATNDETLEKSRRSLREELIRADQLELPFLVLHPGAHIGAGEKAGLEKVVESLDIVLSEIPDCRTKIALETTAGQGTCLGHKFEHLAWILEHSRHRKRLCVCIDTAHLFAAGYDIRTPDGICDTIAEFDEKIGISELAALHFNDSKTELGSHVDRHEHIGEGKIGIEPFRFLMRDSRFADIPKVLETPKGKEMTEDAEAMKLLRSLM